MAEKLRWGILGTGNIAQQFCASMVSSTRGVLAAVGSRADFTAAGFARQFAIPQSYGSYDRVLRDRGIDAVYNALPNPLHHEWTVRALRAGKHVLCEKPMASNMQQAQEMFAAAHEEGCVLIEAFMYRSHPLTHRVVETVRSGAIGRVKLIRSSFCYRTTRIAGNIRFNPAMNGGALMDIGCYSLDFSRFIAGEYPSAFSVAGHIHDSGVDDYGAGTLTFPGGVVASFTFGMTVQVDNTAYICGDEGYIEIPVPWKPPVTQAQFTIARGTPPRMDAPVRPVSTAPSRQTVTVDAGKDLYALEADAFAETVLDGKTAFVSEQDTIGNMRLLDAMRQQLGVRLT